MKFAFFDETGRVESAHNDDTVSELPEGAFLLNDEQWASRCELQLVAGEIEIVPHEITAEDMAANVRRERTRRLLRDVDSINPVRWELMSENERTAVKTYRQALLYVPEQKGFPFSVVWPQLR